MRSFFFSSSFLHHRHFLQSRERQKKLNSNLFRQGDGEEREREREEREKESSLLFSSLNPTLVKKKETFSSGEGSFPPPASEFPLSPSPLIFGYSGRRRRTRRDIFQNKYTMFIPMFCGSIPSIYGTSTHEAQFVNDLFTINKMLNDMF